MLNEYGQISKWNANGNNNNNEQKKIKKKKNSKWKRHGGGDNRECMTRNWMWMEPVLVGELSTNTTMIND